MESLGSHVREYTAQLGRGQIQKAYRGIMAFMSDLRAHLVSRYPDHTASALYYGYMDGTYFALAPPTLRDMRLKIAIVYLHEECKFELCLAGRNRQVQAHYIEVLSHRDVGRYALSQVSPGVDSILTSLAVERPDFDDPEGLKQRIEAKTVEFIKDVGDMLR